MTSKWSLLCLRDQEALTVLFSYRLKEIYRANADKEIFYCYFTEILDVDTADKDEENLLKETLQALKKLHQEFWVSFITELLYMEKTIEKRQNRHFAGSGVSLYYKNYVLLKGKISQIVLICEKCYKLRLIRKYLKI